MFNINSLMLDYDDVLVMPQYSDVNSRSDVDISVNVLDRFKLEFPVIASPMRGIVDAQFCTLLAELGGIGILSRFHDSYAEWMQEAEAISDAKVFGLSIGLHDDKYLDLLQFEPDVLLVDIANGYTQAVLDFCKQVKSNIDKISPKTLLMAGNVATREGVDNLYNSGANLVRCGIGGGSVCSTRNITSIAIPQISAIQDCARSEGMIVCDGGIRNSGDAVKAFVAGADLLMVGSLFGQTFESPAQETIYGMGSRKLMDMQYTQIKSVEGIEKAITKKYSLKQFIEEFSWGIKSAGTYIGARNLAEFYTKGKFVRSGTGSIKPISEIQ